MTKKKIAVVTDSSAYIPANAKKGLDIHVIPLWLLWGDDHYRDEVDIDPPTFYARLKKSDTLPTTSQPSAKEFELFFREVAKGADAIVAVLVSSKISGTIASAQSAASEIKDIDIRIVDTLSCSMGLGFPVLAAARAAAEKKSVDEVVSAAEDMCCKTHTIFVVDTLEYLHRGGRISGGKRLLGTALNIKPLLHFEEGQIRPLSQARTKAKAIETLLDIAAERLQGKKMKEVAILDVDSPQEGDSVAELVKARFSPQAIMRTGVSPVVGTHVGPGTIGLAFYPVD